MLKLVPKYQKGNSFTTGALVDMLYENFPEQRYGKGNYNNVNIALFNKYKPTGKD